MNEKIDYEALGARFEAMDHTPPTAHIIAIKMRDEWRYLVVFDDPRNDDIEIPPNEDRDWPIRLHRSVESVSCTRD